VQLQPSLVNAIPHPTVIGCLAIGLGAFLIGLASEFRGRAKRSRKSRANAQQKAFRFRVAFIATLLVGAACTTFGTLLTIHGGSLENEAKAREATKLLNQTRLENEQARKEFEAKLQTVLFALNAAKQEQTRILTEEKIKGIRRDFLQWAQDFAQRKPDKQRQFEQAKIAERQNEIQISGESIPLFAFVLRFCQEAIDAYTKQAETATTIKGNMPPFPENLYDQTINNTARNIIFGEKSNWNFNISGPLPAVIERPITLIIGMSNSEGRSGSVQIWKIPNTSKFRISGNGTLPVPNATSLFGDYDMADYEDTISRIFQRLLEGQLIDAAMATPSPSPTTR